MSASNLEGKAYLIKYAMYACQILYLCRAIVAFAWKACYFAREMYGDASYLYYFAQSALRNIEQTTDDCDLNNGGRHERNSTRLGFTYYADHRGCVGRYEGFYYGNEAVSQGSRSKIGNLLIGQ